MGLATTVATFLAPLSASVLFHWGNPSMQPLYHKEASAVCECPLPIVEPCPEPEVVVESVHFHYSVYWAVLSVGILILTLLVSAACRDGTRRPAGGAARVLRQSRVRGPNAGFQAGY